MEHVSGVGADNVWFDNTKYQKKELVTGIVDVEKRLFEIRFGTVGSLYFKRDLPAHLQGPLYESGAPDKDRDSETDCIGPIADYMFCCGRRGEVEIDRAPCMSLFPYTR
jgi:cysteinyl-tRNA synthetase